MRKIIYLIILTIFITSCSEDPLEGKVYVIKENGSIVPAAAREVFILPYATLEDFSEALAKEESKIERTSLNNYVSLMCETHADNLSKLKESLLDFQPLPKELYLNHVFREGRSPSPNRREVFLGAQPPPTETLVCFLL